LVSFTVTYAASTSSVSPEDCLDVKCEYGEDQDEKENTRRSNSLMRFQLEHPLSDSHGVRYFLNNSTRVPNFVGANLPRCDQGDREYYCSVMLVLFKPWRQGTDLKAADKLWDEQFQDHSFSEEERRYMHNFNVRYECLDARDDYRAQMKKTGVGIIGSWDGDDAEEVDTNPLDSGPNHKRRAKEMNAVAQMMTSMGWADPIPRVGQTYNSFTPDKIIPGVAWEQEVETLKQKVQDKKNEHISAPGPIAGPQSSSKPHTANVVKVVDKFYLERNFCVEGASDVIDFTVKEFSLNREQEHAF